MSTFATPPPAQHGSDAHERPAQTVMAGQNPTLNNHMNGSAIMHNDIPAAASVSEPSAASAADGTGVNGLPSFDATTTAPTQNVPTAKKVTSELDDRTLVSDSMQPPPIVQEAPAPLISDARNEEPKASSSVDTASQQPITSIEPTPEQQSIADKVVSTVEEGSESAAPETVLHSEDQSMAGSASDPMDVPSKSLQSTSHANVGLGEHKHNDDITTSPGVPPQVSPVAKEEPRDLELSPTPTSSANNLVATATTETTGTKDAEMEDVTSGNTKIAREREEDEDEGPMAKRTKTEDEVMDVDRQPETVSTEFKTPAVPGASNSANAKHDDPLKIVTSVEPAAQLASAEPSTPIMTNGPNPHIADGKLIPLNLPDYGPMTEYQNKKLQEGVRNLKKGKHAAPFQKPVDTVALNLPTYFDVVKSPMDLGTMENKLKNNDYKSVDEYVSDFDLMVNNSIAFNGDKHAVTHNGLSLRAHLQAQLKKIPAAGEAPPETASKKARKQSISAAAAAAATTTNTATTPREPARRASRASFGAAQSPSAGPTYALDTNGLPQIRRDSNNVDGRPTREIRKPPPRDLPYSNAKPRKKKYQMELKFCDWVMTEVKLPRYDHLTFPFKEPVDPVALNIPQYLKIIKHPMDLQTVSNKLHGSEYENAKEFHSDFKLIFANCYKFNGQNHPVSGSAHELEKLFDDLWARKDEWIAENAPASGPHSPVIAESESESEEEEEVEEEDNVEATKAQIAQIQQQIAALSQQAMSLMQGPAITSKSTKKTTKAKSSKKGGDKASAANKATDGSSGAGAKSGGSKRKSSGVGAAGAGKASHKSAASGKSAKAKRQKAITVAEKQEISAHVGELPPEQITRAADLIKASLRRIGKADLADSPDGELEFDIDTIPDDTLHELLKLVRKFIPNTIPQPTPRASNNHHRSGAAASGHSGGTKKKNKPMSKYEQEDRIERLRAQVQSFDASGGQVGSPSDALDDGSSSRSNDDDDDDDSGSESEEE